MGKHAFSQKNFLSYLQLYPDADAIEIAEVRNWMMEGYSPFENGSGICDDKGRTMDFIAAMRFEDAMYEQFKENPDVFLHNMAPAKNCRIGAPDLPF